MSVCLFICSMDSCEEQCPHHTTCWLSPHCRANSHLQYVMTCWPDLFPKLLVAFCFCWYSNFSTSAKHNNLFCNISTLIFLHWQWFHKCTWNRWTDAFFETVVCLGNNKAGCSGTVCLWLTGVWAAPPPHTHTHTHTHSCAGCYSPAHLHSSNSSSDQIWMCCLQKVMKMTTSSKPLSQP